MKRTLLRGFACLALVAMATPALTQSHQLIGSWRLIAADKILPDGKRVADYGTAPHGIAIFTAHGDYVVEIFGSERTKFALADPTKATPEEFKSAFFSHSCHFGTYSTDGAKGIITFNIDRSSSPNLDQTLQVRPFTLKGDTLSWRVPPRADGSIPISVFKRIQ